MNGKYTEAETCHAQSADGWSYYRLCVRISDDHFVQLQGEIYTQFESSIPPLPPHPTPSFFS